MKHFSLITTLLFTLIVTTGCSFTSKYHVTVDALKAPDITVSPSTYVVKSLNKDIDSSGLKFQQTILPLIKVLNEKGYTQVKHETLAEQIIYFKSGIEKVREERETYVDPELGFHVGFGFPFGGYYGRHAGYYPGYYDNDYYRGTYRTYTTIYRYYNRYVTLLAKDQFSKELWRVDVSSVGESTKLRKILPLLIEASKPYIGTSTVEPVEFIVKEKVPKKK